MLPRIYLDNAATSWPKPEAVYTAVDQYMRNNGAPAGRSAYSQAMEVEATIVAARVAIARLIGAAETKQIIFTNNGTVSLNLAIHGLLREGDHAVCTVADHNSVLRPLRQLEQQGMVSVTRLPCSPTGLVDPDDVRRALKPNTRLVAMTHASNVTGIIEPAAEVGKMVRDQGARFLLDAAQSLGHIPIDVGNLNVDLLAAPAHKGLLGPLGVGLLYIRGGIEEKLQSICQGGTGTRSNEDRQPDSLPDKFESGNHNVPGLVGLAVALRWLEARGIASIGEHEQRLATRLAGGLQQISGVTVYGRGGGKQGIAESSGQYPTAVGVVSISVEGYDPQEVAAVLDVNFGIQVRAGLHCAPLMHEALGTAQCGGTVRFSIGPFNTEEDIDRALAAIAKIATSS
jgi:cysteine desulfurase / selenocysteine lyase